MFRSSKDEGFTPLQEDGVAPKAFCLNTKPITTNLLISCFSKRRNKKASPSFCTGFTLVELLVVIAIIGIMASIALISLNSARIKARDSKRTADVREISLALELCYDDAGKYPSTSTFPDPGSPLSCSSRTYITSMASDPNGDSYLYGVDSESNPQKYVIGATLEINTSSILNNSVHGVVYGVNCDSPVYCVQP